MSNANPKPSRGPLPKGKAGPLKRIVPTGAPDVDQAADQAAPDAAQADQAAQAAMAAAQAAMDADQAAQAAETAMDAALARRQARLAELRAKREAADYIINTLVKPPKKLEKPKGVGRRPINWDADLKLACDCAPSPILLPEHFPVRGPSAQGFFVRDPKNLAMLEWSVAENISADRNDKLLTCVREFIAINLETIESTGAQIAELIDIICEEHPNVQASMAWPGKLVGPQSILDQIANVSGRFAILTQDGIVKLKRDFKPRKV